MSEICAPETVQEPYQKSLDRTSGNLYVRNRRDSDASALSGPPRLGAIQGDLDRRPILSSRACL